MSKHFILFSGFTKEKEKKVEKFHFLIIKMAKIYAKFDRIGCLVVGLQQIPLVQNF